MKTPKRPRTSRYFDIRKDAQGREFLAVELEGIALLRLVLTNKGTAFTREERVALGLEGLLPPEVNTLERQVERVYRGYQSAVTPLDRYQYLRALQERQEILYYALLAEHLGEMLPIVYTPTVGDAVKQFSALYQNPRGLSVSIGDVAHAPRMMANYPLEDVRMIVATDSSAILGIGDQGYGGLAIPIGKLALYTVGGGVSPFHTMPVSLDVGTDRADLREDPFYLGARHARLTGDEYLAFLDRFVDAVHARWPRAVIQWEDLAKDAAFTVLDRYRKLHPSFNDDIQGTGAVALAGALRACSLRGERLRDQRIVIHGAGAGGIGVAWALRQGLLADGLSEAEASARLFVLDSRGLLVSDRPGLEPYKRLYAQQGWTGATDLLGVVTQAKATMLIGLSGQPGAFTEPVVRALGANAESPVVFPLSNPTSSCEALPADILRWTDGGALVATGSPFDPVQHGGKTYPIGQGNNAFIFPGLGFGAILSNAREVTDGMVLEAAQALADYTAAQHPTRLYPPVEELQEVSVQVAARVIARAITDGVASFAHGVPRDVEAYVRARFWHAQYLPTVPAAQILPAVALG